MPILDRDLDYLEALRPASQNFTRSMFRRELAQMEALIGVEIRSEVIMELLSLGVLGRRWMALTRLGRGATEEVTRGPFEGLKLVPDHRVREMSITKLLGIYEHELREIITANDHWDHVVNIRSAEGYYATGFARRNANRRVMAHDSDPSAQSATRRTASLNHVENRETVLGVCSPELLRDQADSVAMFWIDIEGAELDLLTSVPAEAMAGSDVLVETHFLAKAFTGLPLALHFQDTHDITVIRQREIQPDEVPEFQSLAPLDRHLITLDRTTPAPWLWMRGVESRLRSR
jgi:hypothetical protein